MQNGFRGRVLPDPAPEEPKPGVKRTAYTIKNGPDARELWKKVAGFWFPPQQIVNAAVTVSGRTSG